MQDAVKLHPVFSEMKKLLDKFHIHYGWFIVILLMIVIGMAYGICHNCYTLFIIPICEKYGYLRLQYTGTFTIRYVCLMVVAFFSGTLYKRFGVLKFMRIFGIVMPVAYFLLSLSNSIFLFYLLETIVGICVPFLAFQAATVIISHWFVEKRGTATGIAFMGSGLFGMIFNALAGKWMDLFGYEMTYRILAGVVLVVLVPILFFILKEKPEDIGLKPYGLKEEKDGESKEVLYGYKLFDAVKKPAFWMLLMIVLLTGFTTSSLSNNIVTNISDHGFSKIYCSQMNAFFLGGVCIAKLVVGMLFDKFGMKKSMVLSMGLLILSFVCMYFANLQFLHPGIIICSMLGCAAGTVAFPLLTQGVCGNRDYAMISGIVTAIGSLGGALCPVITNGMYDTLGNYHLAFIVCMALIMLVLVLTLVIRPMKKPEMN